jgi:hypothetical protein
MRVPGRNESGASGTPPARTLQAPRKTPNSMPARPQRPSLIQSNSDSRAGTKEIARSSHTELISTISQLLQGDEASEDELGPSFTPARAKVVFRRDTSPKVVVSPRPKGKEEAYGMAGDDTPTRVAHLPARKRRHKSRILATEEDSEGEFLMSLPVDDSEDDSDFKPPQPSPTALSPEAKLEAMLKRSRPSKYARKSDCGLQFGLPLARTIFEHDLSSLRLAHPALKPKSGRMGRQHETPQLVFETNVPLAQKNTKTCVTCSAKEPPDWKWMSATVCNVCIVKDVEAGKRMIKVEDKKGKTQNRSRKNASNGKRERPTRDKVMVEGPATIMDMTVAEVTPVLTEQSRAEMAPALLEKPREKTVMFAPEAEIIPDPEEE